MSKTKDMTEGSPFGLIVRFTAPLLLVNVLQLAYTVIDRAVVGRMLGVDAFAAIGATYSLQWLVFSAELAMTQGFGVVFAQRFGAKDFDGLRRSFANAMLITVSLGGVVALLGAFGAKHALALLNTPPELLGDASLYLGIMLGGTLITFIGNTLRAMLFARGDSRTPLYAMIFSTILNIALDFALVVPLGVAGVALAYLLSQAATCVCLAWSLRGVREARFFRRDVSIPRAKELLRVSIPLVLRQGVMESGGLVVQVYVNGFGVAAVAGISAAKTMYSFLLLVINGMEPTVATYAAQNYGAGKMNRVRRGVTAGLWIMLVSSFVIGAAALFFGREMLGLLVAGDPRQIADMLDAGQRQLSVMAVCLPVLSLLFLYRAAIQGVGNTLIPMLSGLAELAGRFAAIFALTPLWGIGGVCLAEPMGWFGAALLLVISYFIIIKRLLRPRRL